MILDSGIHGQKPVGAGPSGSGLVLVPDRTRAGKILEIPDQLRNLGPNRTTTDKISKPGTGPEQDQQNRIGQFLDHAVRGSLLGLVGVGRSCTWTYGRLNGWTLRKPGWDMLRTLISIRVYKLSPWRFYCFESSPNQPNSFPYNSIQDFLRLPSR